MTRFRSLTAVAFAVVALVVSGFVIATASAGPLKREVRRSLTYRTLTVKITETGYNVWGKVAIKPTGKTCTKVKCTYKVKSGTKLTLTQTPTNSATWPFSHWVLNNKSAGTGNTLSFKIGKHSTVGAVYVSGGSTGGTLTVSITYTPGTTWGTVSIPTVGNCNKSQCVFKNLPLGQSLTLTETPTDPATWPFNGWTLNGTDEGKATTLTFTMSQTDTVDANYVPAS